MNTWLRRLLSALGISALGLTVSCDPLVVDFQDIGAGTPRIPNEGGAGGESPILSPGPDVILDASVDLSRETVSERNCPHGGEMPAYDVLSLSDGGFALRSSPSEDCLIPGDEVLLIELQASVEDANDVGRHALLKVNRIDDSVVSTTTIPLWIAEAEAQGAWNVENKRVVLQRVPHFSSLTVNEGVTVTGSRWTQGGTGLFVVRIHGDLRLDGAISMNAAGYGGGPERSLQLAHGLQGESIAGLGVASTAPHWGGGGGGMGDRERDGCVQDGNAGGGGGHLTAGGDAVISDLCDGVGRGRGGSAYAEPGKLFLGSGGGSGGVDNVLVDNPPGAPGGNGGGIVWLLADSVSGAGTIFVRGGDGVGDPPDVECESGGSTTSCYDHSGAGGGGAGGTIRISAPEVAGVLFDVSGGKGGNGFDGSSGNGGDGSIGVLEISRF